MTLVLPYNTKKQREIHPAALIEEIVGEERQKEDARSERLAERHIDERKGEEEEEEESVPVKIRFKYLTFFNEAFE